MDELVKERQRLLEKLERINQQIQEQEEKEKEKLDYTKLTLNEYKRYGRQMILDGIGLDGQLRLKNASVLIIGAGGLGAPAMMYLAASGVGHLGIVDPDDVDESNLHRQVIHKEQTCGRPKVESAKWTAQGINSRIQIKIYNCLLDSSNALDIISKYDVVLDCSDNVPTRYLISDACVLARKPLVSGSAIRFQGQLMVYNFRGSPCYRCLYPTPPPPETVTSCADGGVLGIVPGIIGSLQALEATKIILDMDNVSQKLVLFDALSAIPFRYVTLRKKRKDCPVCGDDPTITELQDYIQFCGSSPNDKGINVSVLDQLDRITVQDLAIIRKSDDIRMLDVREEVQFGICHFDESENIPLRHLGQRLDEFDSTEPFYVICRFGNDSQLAVQQIKQRYPHAKVKDVIGGLAQWSKEIDPNFPVY